MTFATLQDRVMSRLNWSASANRDLVKAYINDRLRRVQSSLNLTPTRRGITSVATVSGNAFATVTGVAKVLGIVDAVTLKRPLLETTAHLIRAKDPAAEVTGVPEEYAIYTHLADSVQLQFYPKPDAVHTLSVDALLIGTELTSPSDEPTFPEDFHDILIHGAEADGWARLEKPKLADRAERAFEQRMSELRYFLVKSANTRNAPYDRDGLPAIGRNVWPFNIPT